MKYLLLSSIFFLGLNANSGNLQEDPVLALLQDKFSKAHPATMEELTKVRTWNCTTRSAYNHDFTTTEQKPGYIFDLENELGIDSLYNSSTTLAKQFYFTSFGLSATYIESPYTYVQVLRINSEGQLLVESISEQIRLKVPPITAIPHGSYYKVTFYKLCKPAK